MDPLEFEGEDERDYDRYATIPALAAEHEISAYTLYSAASSGRLITHRIGGRILVDRKDAERFAKLHKLYKTNI